MSNIKTSFLGPVKLVLMNEEFYPIGIIDCAAGHEVDITDQVSCALANNYGVELEAIEIISDEGIHITDLEKPLLFDFTQGEDRYQAQLDFVSIY